MSQISNLCACIDFDEEIINFKVFINNIVYHNLNKNKIISFEISTVPKEEIKNEDLNVEVKEEVKTEVKKGPKTAAERQRERRQRLKEQVGEEEYKKQNKKKMKEYRAKQKEEKNDDNIDDDNISTTSSTNNKMRSEENMINCECGCTYHMSYKSRHLKSKNHIEGLKKKEEQKIEPKDNKYEMAQKFVKNIIDIDGKTIMLHPNINELYDEINRYIKMYVDNKSTERQLNRNINISIKEFMDDNDIKYEHDLFLEFENYSDDSCDESD